MIVDARGRPIGRTKTAQAVIFLSVDLESWEPIKPHKVPTELRDRDVMGHLIAGEIVCLSEEGPYYRAEAVQ